MHLEAELQFAHITIQDCAVSSQQTGVGDCSGWKYNCRNVVAYIKYILPCILLPFCPTTAVTEAWPIPVSCGQTLILLRVAELVSE